MSFCKQRMYDGTSLMLRFMYRLCCGAIDEANDVARRCPQKPYVPLIRAHLAELAVDILFHLRQVVGDNHMINACIETYADMIPTQTDLRESFDEGNVLEHRSENDIKMRFAPRCNAERDGDGSSDADVIDYIRDNEKAATMVCDITRSNLRVLVKYYALASITENREYDVGNDARSLRLRDAVAQMLRIVDTHVRYIDKTLRIIDDVRTMELPEFILWAKESTIKGTFSDDFDTLITFGRHLSRDVCDNLEPLYDIMSLHARELAKMGLDTVYPIVRRMRNTICETLRRNGGDVTLTLRRIVAYVERLSPMTIDEKMRITTQYKMAILIERYK